MTEIDIYESLANNFELVSEADELRQKANARIAEMYQRLANSRRGTDASIDQLTTELLEFQGKISACADDGIVIDPPNYTGDSDWVCEDNAHDTERPPAPTEITYDDSAKPLSEAFSEIREAFPQNDDAPETNGFHLEESGNVLSDDILRALCKCTDPQTIGQIAMVVGAKPDGIRPTLTKLVENGRVVKSGERRGTRYAISVPFGESAAAE